MENQNPTYQMPTNQSAPLLQSSPQPPAPMSSQNQSAPVYPRRSGFKKLLTALLIILLLLVAIYITYIASTAYVLTKLDKAYVVDGPSMAPALNNGEKVLVANYNVQNTKLLNTSTAINDLVVFKTNFQGKSYTIIKRVVAVAGQRVVIANNKLTVYDTMHANGFDPTTAYEPSGVATAGSVDTIVPSGDVYVLGDNRPDSLDSRAFGPVAESSLTGKVIGKITQP